MSDEPDKAAAGVSVSKTLVGRQTKTSVVVKSGDFKITARWGWGRQSGGGNGGRAVAGTEVGVAFHLMLRRLQWCLRRAEGAVLGPVPAVQPAVPGRAGWAPGFRQSWDRGEMQQGREGGGTRLRGSGTPGDDARTVNCVNAERSFASLVSLKPPCLFGGEGSVV